MVALVAHRVETLSHGTSYGSWDSRGTRVSHDIHAAVTRDGAEYVGTVAVDGTLYPAVRFHADPAPDGRYDIYPDHDYEGGALDGMPARWALDYMIRRGIDAADALDR